MSKTGGSVRGIGVDVIDVARTQRLVERHAGRLDELFTQGEIAYCRRQRRAEESYAVRLAAKEATMKALGTLSGFLSDWREIEVVSDPGGRPTLELHGAARRAAEELEGTRTWLSLSHGGGIAVAQVVLTSE